MHDIALMLTKATESAISDTFGKQMAAERLVPNNPHIWIRWHIGIVCKAPAIRRPPSIEEIRVHPLHGISETHQPGYERRL